MKVSTTPISGLLVIEPDVFHDDRGYFFESFNSKKYHEAGLDFNFVQDNISRSVKNSIRGLHYQVGNFAQGKLCQVISGVVLDVAVDIRFGSPTFGKYHSQVLSEENKKQFWLPPGFAHGFSVLSDIAIFSYKCTSFYSKKDERCIYFNDEQLGIDWGIKNPVISEKDKYGIAFKDIESDFKF
ncbi:MAG: dTDP-4-dehydrorhamnose 3,5-epimerase [Ignavibacteriaceae bacterium]|jgi:dTDP-4-dehydrorhamnose 3,5-epimerase (EC 5.1.3.13)|nr:MAG: dTDP-4-dehydrorhamnose 3,5-epimerase [Chlorobiota bacterium]KXK04694.1 MAG: dTDP-4-dehydrorhamnose 3,5-epimerase [Chlorobi bacterium OLB4]MBV6399443.1 dTDP-4-dehydrorhamnose 3,5-epimerase [Ignavibacteria bacterium]MCC6886713.1 dTDP-4-dehydrorhamnose 3,5-epimerase [Ignavibacteriales bacterium]MCE7953148.1 dTDP-4-dehydrorhamnose 3,5-epimerase [Chlorobi bacterium CHB7]MEB2329069.1 dTDP-4-dehydrorhamnose 3,5-epimerase [Ignavibacteriaceae bacterium]OQY76604.1 MAG: dTDP-4-dehydrorhamnose 3,